MCLSLSYFVLSRHVIIDKVNKYVAQTILLIRFLNNKSWSQKKSVTIESNML